LFGQDVAMTAVGVVGLGNIGGAIAANLVADGHEVTVTDVDAGRAAAVTGATAVVTVADVAAGSEITVTSLPTPEVVAAVAGEWADAAAPGSILLDLSTTLPAGNQAIATHLAASGHHFVEAPLTGGAVGAQNRSLVFMVGGDPEPVVRVTPLLDQLGRATIHLGPVGTGTTMKLVNSLLAFVSTWSSLEALSMAVAAGIDVRTAVEVVRTGGASNFFIDRAVEGINQRDRPAQFTLDLAAKDAGLIQEVADGHGVSAAMASAMVEVLQDTVARGLGERDWSDLVVAAEQRSGVELTIRPKAEA
jgi:3-hydroxyisobutyrate dehydrogenase